ncbi:MAG: alpha/beta fold hydrolase [Burkholderiales bacterium]|nr:alpha/beta fold hydrolase [Burkholderiales bacterium]
MSAAATELPEERQLASSQDPGARMHVRTRGPSGGTPLVLVHGFFQPASAILDVPGWSLQQALAGLGRRVVLFDLRGYGQSTRPAFMDQPPEASRPALGRLADAVADIGDVVEHVCRVEGCPQVDLLGYSWGTARSCAYALRSPQRVRRLVLYAPVWRPVSGAAAEAAEPGHPALLNRALGGYRAFGAGDLERQWDGEIGAQDTRAFRDARALQAAEQALLASDAALRGRGYRSPLGPMQDALAVAQGRPLFDATGLRGEVLLIRGDHDRLSSAADADGLMAALGTDRRRLVTVGQGTHLLHLEHARTTLIDEIAAFIGDTLRPAPQDRAPC